MPSPEITEFQTYLDGLIEATRNGSVQWNMVNPTTYVWESGGLGKGARVNLQRLDRTVAVRAPGGAIVSKRMPSYIFQASERSEGEIIQRVFIESGQDEELNRKFDVLYEVIKSGLSTKGMEFLKSILPSH
jgi:hypothetical protein